MENKALASFLRSLASGLEVNGFPKEPFIIQGDPQDSECFFIALWRNVGDREVTKLEVPE